MFAQTQGFTAFQLYDKERLLKGFHMSLLSIEAMSGGGHSESCCVVQNIISASVRTTPNVDPDLGDCGRGGGTGRNVVVCVVLFCDLG